MPVTRRGVLVALALPLMAGAFMPPTSSLGSLSRQFETSRVERSRIPRMVATPGVGVEEVSVPIHTRHTITALKPDLARVVTATRVPVPHRIVRLRRWCCLVLIRFVVCASCLILGFGWQVRGSDRDQLLDLKVLDRASQGPPESLKVRPRTR